MNWKKGKWADVELTENQKQGQRMWRAAQKRRQKIESALRLPAVNSTREELIARMNWYLDRIENSEQGARILFPEVEESFTIASTTI